MKRKNGALIESSEICIQRPFISAPAPIESPKEMEIEKIRKHSKETRVQLLSLTVKLVLFKRIKFFLFFFSFQLSALCICIADRIAFFKKKKKTHQINTNSKRLVMRSKRCRVSEMIELFFF